MSPLDGPPAEASSFRGRAAITGVGELAPSRYTQGETNLGLMAKVGLAALRDAGTALEEVDGLLVHPIGGVSMMVPSTVAEFLGVQVRYAEVVDLGYAPSLTDTAIRPAADAAFAMAGVGRDRIGLASVYDCYTITVVLTLEDAGFGAKGEGGRFVEEHDLRWNGDFPLNTHGGQLSFGQAGIAGGMSHVTEAARQVQGRAGGRQVPGLELAFVNGDGGIMSEQASLVLGANP